MVNILNNLAVYRLVDEYYISTQESTSITIRVIECIAGAQDFSFKATPYFPLFDSPATSQFQGVGPTADDALQACLKAIDGVSLVDMVTPIAIQQSALKKQFVE